MDVTVDRAGGEDSTVTSHDLRRRPDNEIRVHTVGRVGVTCSSDGRDAAVTNADIGFHDAPVVEDDCAGDHEIRSAFGAGIGRLTHRLADDFPAAKNGLVTADAVIGFDFDE